ncbi:hypothetical protein CEXT_646681, partial [Caerostris extrusa]
MFWERDASLNDGYTVKVTSASKNYNFSSIYLGPRERSPNYQKLCTPSNHSLVDVANVSPSMCYDRLLLGRSSFLIKDDSSA